MGDIAMKAGPSNAGVYLSALAKHVVDTRAFEGAVEPTLADLQQELRAIARGTPPHARLRVLVLGYVAFWKVIVIEVLTGRAHMRVRFASRMAAITVSSLVAYVVALRVVPMLLTALPGPSRGPWTLYAAVQGVASMMPFAVFVAVLSVARQSSREDRNKRVPVYLMVTAVAFLAARAVSLWVLPSVTAALDVARHATTVAAPWTIAVVGSIRPALGVAGFALLALALAPYARRVPGFLLAIVLIPPVFVLGESVLLALTVRRMGLSAMAVVSFLPYLMVFCLAGLWVVFHRPVPHSPA